jgi:hypothetical protein
VFGVPDEADAKELQNFHSLIEGEVTAGSAIEVKTSAVWYDVLA